MNNPSLQVLNILLLIDTSHYVAITNLDRFLNSCRREHSHSMYHCPRCLQPFSSSIRRSEHLCSSSVQAYEMPKEKNYKFINWQKTEQADFVIYADIECLLVPSTEKNVLQTHKPIATAYLVVSNHSSLEQYKVFTGESCLVDFLKSLEETATYICEWMRTHYRQPLKMTEEEESCWESASVCYMCSKTFTSTETKCRDHDHRNGSYRGAACSDCNRRRQMQRQKITVVMHNFKNYDVHHVVREGLQAMTHWSISVIPLTFEKYLTLQARFPLRIDASCHCLLSFIDSFQFLNSSLAKLVEICPSMNYTTKAVPESMIHGKGVFPYGYLTSISVLDETRIPHREAFFDNLSQTHISEDDYQRAQKAWNDFECRTMKDYMLAYLKMDVHQLADIFENFRLLTLQEDGLDPAHYFSTPGLSWDAAFKHSHTQIDLLLDEEQYNFFERGRRGGMTFVNKHYAKRNSLDDGTEYNPDLPHVELLYIGKENKTKHLKYIL
jgi:hypothetical protein